MRRKTLLLTLGLLLVTGYWIWAHQGGSDWELRSRPEQVQAVAEIKRQGGRVRVEETTDGQKGITVAFNGQRVTDANLAPLQGLTGLHTLYLHDPQVTGAGLAYLGVQSQLHTLSLLDTKVSDASLAHLKGLGQLR